MTEKQLELIRAKVEIANIFGSQFTSQEIVFDEAELVVYRKHNGFRQPLAVKGYETILCWVLGYTQALMAVSIKLLEDINAANGR